jgi:hypothetical protein
MTSDSSMICSLSNNAGNETPANLNLSLADSEHRGVRPGRPRRWRPSHGLRPASRVGASESESDTSGTRSAGREPVAASS